MTSFASVRPPTPAPQHQEGGGSSNNHPSSNQSLVKGKPTGTVSNAKHSLLRALEMVLCNNNRLLNMERATSSTTRSGRNIPPPWNMSILVAILSLVPLISASFDPLGSPRSMPRLYIQRHSEEAYANLWGVSGCAIRGGADFVSEEISSEEQLVETEEEESATITLEKKKEEEPSPEEEVDNSEAKATSFESITGNKYGDPSKYIFSVYQPGDGSDKDPDNLPRRFLDMQKGNRPHAKQALETTLKFRKEESVDTILQRPHPTFDICKAITPHCFAGRDVTNHVVFFQRPAMVHLDMAKANDISNHDLVMHYVYVLEYCWNLLDPPVPTEDEDDDRHNTMTSVIDLTGLDFSILRHRELIGFVREFVQMMSAHYPQRSYKTLLLNAPSWFGMLYKMLSPMLRDSTKAKIEILSHGKHQTEKLRELLGDECLTYLPQELLETDKKKMKQAKETPTPVSPMEEEFRNFCLDRLADAGKDMQPLITVD